MLTIAACLTEVAMAIDNTLGIKPIVSMVGILIGYGSNWAADAFDLSGK